MSRRKPNPTAAVSLLALLALPTLALAAGATEECPPGNLLRGARVVDSLDVVGSARLAVNDTVLVEGAPRGRGTVAFETPAAALTFDLGRSTRIEAVFLQAEAGNDYSFQVSEDGEHFEEVWKVPRGTTKRRGMRSTFMTFSETSGRFVRFGEPTFSQSASVSELQVYCRTPIVWPPMLSVQADSAKGGRRWPRVLAEKELSRVKLSLALLGVAIMVWGRFLERRSSSKRWARLRDGLLLALGAIGLWGYFNWSPYLSGRGVHYYEFFHYYVGSKYFPELGYAGLYECASLAETEMGFGRRVERRTMRDLRTNRVVRATEILDRERAKQGFTRPFTPERWSQFKDDIAYFRAHMNPARWERMLQDHGYNPSPVWNVTGSLLANTGPASEPFVEGVLRWIDPTLIVLAFAFVVWAFGWRVACVAALYFGTNDLGSHFWVGGAFLRMDWFFWAIVGLCLLKRGHPLLGGAGLGISALLRVFPGGFLVPVVLRMLWILYRERRVDPTGARILAGAALVAALLIPVSAKVAGGWAAWPEFFRNTRKQTESPMTNHVGLRTVLAFQWEARQKLTYDPTDVDPFRHFREARTKAFRGNLVLFAALVLGYLALLLFALRREKEAWVWAVFGFGAIPIGVELTCYYYSCLLVAAFLWERRPRIAIGLLLLAVLGQIVTLGTYFYDIRFYFHSVLVVAFVVWAAWEYGRHPTPPVIEPQASG